MKKMITIRTVLLTTIIQKKLQSLYKENTMKAFVLTKTGQWRIYNSEKDDSDAFKFLYYAVGEDRILLLASLMLSKEIITHPEIHAQLPKEFIPDNQLPIGAGLIEMFSKKARSWESLTMEIETSQQYRDEISEFLGLKKL